MQVVLTKNAKEKLGKGRHQTGGDGAHEERVKGAPFVLRQGGAVLERCCPLVALRNHHVAREGEFLL